MKKFYTSVLFLLLMVSFGYSQSPVNPITPAEYNPSSGVLVRWAHGSTHLYQLYLDLTKELVTECKVHFLVKDDFEQNWLTVYFAQNNVATQNILYVRIPANRIWIRDHGPFSVNDNGALSFIDYINFANSPVDDSIPTRLANIWQIPSFRSPLIFDGGNFMMDNFGNIFTTKKVFKDNPQYTPQQILQIFAQNHGAVNHHAVKSQHNDYWGHIDMQIKLLNDTTIIIATCDSNLPNYDSLEANYQYLKTLTAPNGRPYHIEKIKHAENWKTYVNSLIINNKVLVPIYNSHLDTVALNVYNRLMPDKEIIGINCNPIINWEGAIHCITMQIPDVMTNIISEVTPIDFYLHQNYPNPFNPETKIRFEINKSSDVTLTIFDLLGRQVSELVNEKLEPGSYEYNFTAGALTSGLYFYRLQADDYSETRRMILLK